MRNVVMIRREPGLVSIPVESAVYCGNCENSLDIIWAAVRTLRIGGHNSIGPPDSRTVGSEPVSSRGLGRLKVRVIRGDMGF